MTPTQATLYWIGDGNFRDFRELLPCLPPTVLVRTSACCADAMAASETTEPDWIAVALRWPGEVRHTDLDALRRRFPLTPLLLVLGSWCEGETRSGNPYPETVRLFWHQFSSWFRGEFDRWQQQRGLCQLPTTVSPSERWLAAMPALPDHRTGRVLIRSSDLALGAFLRDACQSLGYEVAELSDSEPHSSSVETSVLWCLSDHQPAEYNQLAAWIESSSANAAVLAVIGYPRSDTADRLRGIGTCGVLSLPLDVHLLQDELQRVYERKS